LGFADAAPKLKDGGAAFAEGALFAAAPPNDSTGATGAFADSATGLAPPKLKPLLVAEGEDEEDGVYVPQMRIKQEADALIKASS
jgi:hypothetical protein